MFFINTEINIDKYFMTKDHQQQFNVLLVPHFRCELHDASLG